MAQPSAQVSDWTPEVAVQVDAPRNDEWDHRLTRFRSRAVMHYGLRENDGTGEKVLTRVLLGRGDTFTMRCSKVRGRWVGPDAAGLELLMENGEILGSTQAEAKDAAEAAAEHARAVYPGAHPAFPQGRPGLRVMDKARAEELHRRYTGPMPELLRMEGQESRADRIEQNDTLAALARMLQGATVAKDWPGAEGPGTGPVAQGA